MAWNHYEGNPQAMPIGPSAAVSQVQTVMSEMAARTDTFTANALEVLKGLEGVKIEGVGPAPTVNIAHNVSDMNWAIKDIALANLGEITIPTLSEPELVTPPQASLNPVPVFTPKAVIASLESFKAPELPKPPEYMKFDSKGLDKLTPNAPTILMPNAPILTPVTIPEFEFPELPSFSEKIPEFNVLAPLTMIEWTEKDYKSENYALMLKKVSDIITNGSGLPPDVERQLFERARSREYTTAHKLVSEAFDTFASKGFVTPPGMLVEQVNAALETSQLQSNALSREIYIKAMDTQLENMRFAVQQGVAAENIMQNIFQNAMQRTFEIAKYNVESQIHLYDAQVNLYNVSMNAFQTKATVYKTMLEGQLAKIDVYKAELDAQRLVGELNQQAVQLYNSNVQTLNTQVELYRTEMEAAKIKLELIKAPLDVNHDLIQQYAEQIGVNKLQLDIYKGKVEAQAVMAGILDSEARAFSATANVSIAQNELQLKNVQMSIEQEQATTQRFVATVENAKAVLMAQTAKIESAARVESLKLQSLAAQSDANRAKMEAVIRIGEQQLQSNIAAIGQQVKLYETSITRIIEEAKLKSNSMAAAGQIAATLAGGAMAAQHVQASISTSSGESVATQSTFSQSASENWSYSPDAK